MKMELRGLPPGEALAIMDLVSDDPDVQSCEREWGDDPHAFGIAEVSLFLAIVVGVGATARFVAETAYSIRQRFRPFIVIDCSESEPRIHVIKGIPGMRGEFIVKSKDGGEVRVGETASSTQVAAAVLGALKP